MKYCSHIVYLVLIWSYLIELSNSAKTSFEKEMTSYQKKLAVISKKRDRYNAITMNNTDLYYQCYFRPTEKVTQLIGKNLSKPIYNDDYTTIHLVAEKIPLFSEIPNNYLYGHYMQSSDNSSNAINCPYILDYQGKIHESLHACVSSRINEAYIFTISNVTVTVCGGLFDDTSQRIYTFNHPSMGYMEPIHYHEVHLKWIKYYTDSVNMYVPDQMKSYDYVIPLRMAWDGNFGHLYHQSIPFIAHVMEFVSKDVWSQAYWHCSTSTAALLMLVDVSSEKILSISLFQKKARQHPIIAKNLILPWMKGWCPSLTASTKGIANKLLKTITKNLLSKFNHSAVDRIGIHSKRTIIYLPRSKSQTRYVVNDDEIIQLLNQHVNKNLYEVVVSFNQSKEHHVSIDNMHQAWYQYAKTFSVARVVIGSHGSAFGNIMWTPDDTDFIEFNVFPDDPVYTQASSKCHHRASLISAAWAKGGQSRIFNIDPSMKSMDSFYESNIRVSPYELLAVLGRIGDDIIILSPQTTSPYSIEEHNYWSVNSSMIPKKSRNKHTFGLLKKRHP